MNEWTVDSRLKTSGKQYGTKLSWAWYVFCVKGWGHNGQQIKLAPIPFHVRDEMALQLDVGGGECHEAHASYGSSTIGCVRDGDTNSPGGIQLGGNGRLHPGPRQQRG